MTERPKSFDDEDRRKEELAPEIDNAEQDEDAGEQAQTVADEARNRSTDIGLEDSVKVPTGDDSDDAQDLVDRMRQMDSSGHIDMDAYAGEPNHDDNVDKYGEKSKIDKLRGDGT
jgi:hypothetical protein